MDTSSADPDPTSAVGEIPWVHSPFAQPWWLEAVAPGQWGAVVVDRGGDVVARLPYVYKQRFGLRVLTHAPLTRYLGPWVRATEGKSTRRLGLEKDLMEELIQGLPTFDAYHAEFAPAVTNWLPFYWAGFEATVHYTYRIEDVRDLDTVWANCDKDVRMKVRRAQRVLEVRTDLGLDHLLPLQRRTFGRQGLPVPFGDELVRRLDRACAARGARTVVSAVDADGRVHAGGYFVHDRETTYLLLGGPDPELATSGAYLLVIWEAIRRSAARTPRFDFLGSMMERIERVNRGFGALPVPYLSVSRQRPRVRVARATAGALRGAVRVGPGRLRDR